MEQIKFTKAFFIKLGAKGRYEPYSIPEGKARIGFHNFTLEKINSCLWDELMKMEGPNYDKKGVAARDVNMLRYFVESTSEDVWITFHNRHLYWCRLENTPLLEDSISRYRTVTDRWLSYNIKGQELIEDQIPGNISKIQRFPAAICRVKEVDALERLINGVPSEAYQGISQAKDVLVHEIEKGLRLLHWKDFEILVDLLFRNAGWNRVSKVGETMKYVDIVLEEPISGERYLVQVKAEATREDFDKFLSQIPKEGYNKLYFITHSPDGDFTHNYDKVEVMLPEELAKKVVGLGLTDWLMKKIQ